MLNFLTIERSAKTRKPTEGSKRNEGVILAPKLDLRFLRLLAKAFGVGFCKNARCVGTRKSTEGNEGNEGFLVRTGKEKSLFPLLPSVKLFHQ
jgi:hypothetical protein